MAARISPALRRRAVPELVEPYEPYLLRDLTIDYAQSRVTVAGRPVELAGIEYRMLAELSVSAGQVLTNVQLLQTAWGLGMRSIVKRLRPKLGDDPDNPIYIFNEPRVGYRMERGQTTGPTQGR